MASEVLSGAANASYTNNTGQNVRLVINYMSNTTSMTWAGVNVTASATTIGKDIQNISGEFRSAVTGRLLSSTSTSGLSDAELLANPVRGDRYINTYQLEVSTKRTNLNEYWTTTPKNQNGTYANAGTTNIELANNWRMPSMMWPTLENSANPRAPFDSMLRPGNLRYSFLDGYYGPDSLNFRPFIGRIPTSFYADAGLNLFYVPLTVSRGGNFPVELMLANGQSFSAVCGAFNAIIIKEDGT